MLFGNGGLGKCCGTGSCEHGQQLCSVGMVEVGILEAPNECLEMASSWTLGNTSFLREGSDAGMG